jgi:hypothetical protein
MTQSRCVYSWSVFSEARLRGFLCELLIWTAALPMLAIAGNVILRCGRNPKVLGYRSYFRKKRCVESGFQED